MIIPDIILIMTEENCDVHSSFSRLRKQDHRKTSDQWKEWISNVMWMSYTVSSWTMLTILQYVLLLFRQNIHFKSGDLYSNLRRRSFICVHLNRSYMANGRLKMPGPC
jgi:hypothetical protein